MQLPNSLRKLILLNILFSGGRLFVGAISVVYFLSFGFKPEDFVLIKGIQSVIFVVLDIPLGYLMKRIGEYRSILLALALGSFGCYGYTVASALPGFMFSETLIALSLSIWPVAFTSYSMQSIETYREKNPGIVEKFFHTGDSLSQFSVLICGTAGGFLYQYSKYYPYYGFLILYLSAITFVLLFLQNLQLISSQKHEQVFVPKPIWSYGYIAPIVALLVLIQFSYQPLLHYWQPLFIEKHNVQPQEMSIIFISYSLAMSFVSWCYSRLTSKSTFRSVQMPVFLGCLAGFIYFLQTMSLSFFSSVVLFSLLFSIMNVIQVSSSVYLQNLLKKEERVVTTKYISFLARLGMIISLGAIHLILSSNGGSIISLFGIYGAISCFTFFSVLLFIILAPKLKGKMYVFES